MELDQLKQSIKDLQERTEPILYNVDEFKCWNDIDRFAKENGYQVGNI
jgi:hypothetical protein